MAINKMRMAIAGLATSAIGFVQIVSHEGYAPVAVAPVKGDVCTVGFGTTGGVKCGETITPHVALARAMRDVAKFESAIARCVTVPLHQHEYDVLVSFAYNVGGDAFCKSTLVRKLNAGDYEGACNQLPRWVMGPGGVRLPGLVTRRAREREQCLSITK